jgi:hypothetical protein
MAATKTPEKAKKVIRVRDLINVPKVIMGDPQLGIVGMTQQRITPGSLAFYLDDIATEAERVLDTFERQRKAVIEEFGQKDDNGEWVTDSNNQYDFGENKAEAIAALDELLDTEVDVSKFPMLTADQFDKIGIMPAEARILRPFRKDV